MSNPRDDIVITPMISRESGPSRGVEEREERKRDRSGRRTQNKRGILRKLRLARRAKNTLRQTRRAIASSAKNKLLRPIRKLPGMNRIGAGPKAGSGVAKGVGGAISGAASVVGAIGLSMLYKWSGESGETVEQGALEAIFGDADDFMRASQTVRNEMANDDRTMAMVGLSERAMFDALNIYEGRRQREWKTEIGLGKVQRSKDMLVHGEAGQAAMFIAELFGDTPGGFFDQFKEGLDIIGDFFRTDPRKEAMQKRYDALKSGR